MLTVLLKKHFHQRWSSRGQTLKFLASKPQVLENCPVLGSRTALFFEPLKFCWKAPETSQKICVHLFLFSSGRNRLKKNFLKTFFAWKKIFNTFFFEIAWKIFLKTFFLENTCACVLGLKRVCPWPRNLFVSLASSLVSSTPPLIFTPRDCKFCELHRIF